MVELYYLMTNDLRLHDNKSLDAFLKYSGAMSTKAVCFVFDPEQADPQQNAFFNKRAFGVFHAAVIQITHILETHHITVEKHRTYDFLKNKTVIMSSDVSPFARQRLAYIESIASKVCVYDNKHLASEPKKKYKVYSAYYKSVIPELLDVETNKYKTLRKKESDKFPKPKLYSDALKMLSGFNPEQYYRTRKASVLTRSGSTNVSWAISRGIVSVREVYEHCRKECLRYAEEGIKAMDMLVRELIFRDFYSRATLWFTKKYGDVLTHQNKVHWKIKTMSQYIKAVDDAPEVIQVIYKALMKTGQISNYGRMLFATWTYDIGADWHLGEKLFAQELLDYDYSSNHWNWAHHSIQGLNHQWPGKKYKIDNVTLYA